MNSPLLLCFRINEETCAALKKLGKPFGAQLKRVSPAAYSLPLAAIAAGMEGQGSPLLSDFPEPMLVFVNFPEVMLDSFLDAMRARGIRVPLKAIVTEHNAVWTPHTLYRELCAEREAIQTKRG